MIAHFYDQQGGGFFDMPNDACHKRNRRAYRPAQAVPGFADSGRRFRRRRRAAPALFADRREMKITIASWPPRRWKFSPAWPSSSASTPAPTDLPPSGWRVPTRKSCSWAAVRRPTRLHAAAVKPFAVNKTFIHITEEEAVAAYLPPALTDSVPHLPGIAEGRPLAIVCSNFTCQPPVSDPDELTKLIYDSIRHQ